MTESPQALAARIREALGWITHEPYYADEIAEAEDHRDDALAALAEFVQEAERRDQAIDSIDSWLFDSIDVDRSIDDIAERISELRKAEAERDAAVQVAEQAVQERDDAIHGRELARLDTETERRVAERAQAALRKIETLHEHFDPPLYPRSVQIARAVLAGVPVPERPSAPPPGNYRSHYQPFNEVKGPGVQPEEKKQ